MSKKLSRLAGRMGREGVIDGVKEEETHQQHQRAA